MHEVVDVQELITNLRGGNFYIIGIDGADGSGKSYLAAQIIDQLNYFHINLDDYIKENCGGFVAYLKADQLKQTI
ncbi:MAG: hypothetical protein P8130_13955, partial [Deltaproteobacteria bacterium]